MLNDLGTATSPSITGLVSGIVNDAQELIKQQMTLFRHDLQVDIRKTKEGALSLGIGLGVAALGGLLLALMLVHLLQSLAPELPLWGCYGIVGGVLIGVGGILCYAGKKIFDSFSPLPNESVQALKENVRWITKAK